MQIEIVVGNIVRQPDVDALVNSANANLRFGSGVAGAIHTAAGPELEQYCRRYSPIALGEAVVTPGFELPNPYIIHARAASYINDDHPERYLGVPPTYFVMWCRTFDHSLLVIDNPMTLAVEAGFSGERALSTWKDRMRSLVELGFIDAKEGSAGPFHYVLLLNPHKVVWQLKDRIQEGTFRQLQTRAIEIGAKDMEPAKAPTAATAESPEA